MGLRMLGDSAWLFEAGGSDARGRLDLILKLVRLLEAQRIPEIRDVVSSFDTLAVHFDPGDGERVLEWLKTLPPPAPDGGDTPPPRKITVPVIYGGTDLEKLASSLKRSEEEIIALHSDADYQVAAVGFSPGFPYLSGLPEALRIPRRATPQAVAAGSVAIAGEQAGIYPFASQGGWHVMGRTNLPLFDPQHAEPALLQPGDHVRFEPAEHLEFPETPDPNSSLPVGSMEVIESGALTTVQDLGRPGYQKIGISHGGAADPISARVANRLVGNPDDAALLECCMTGPLLKFHQTARVAWVGWADAASGKPMDVQAGDELNLRGRMAAVRGYVAISGGIDLPLVLGSRATDLRAGFGGYAGRVLQTGDRLPVGAAANALTPGGWRIGWPHANAGMIELRFVKGVQSAWFEESTRKAFKNAIYQVSPMSDRTGARLDGPPLELLEPREMISQPVVAGSIQVPPDGRPIVLMAERQTIGGYPQIGHVISADLPKLARAWPGTKLRFREVTLDDARDAWGELQRELGLLQAGLRLLS